MTVQESNTQRDAVGSSVARIVAFCSRHAPAVIAAWLIAGAIATLYAVSRFAIDTDTGDLISADLPWRQRQIALEKAFPQRGDLIVVVIDGRTPELASRAAAMLAQRLAADTASFKAVWRPDGGAFFERNGLLFLSQQELRQKLEPLVAAQALLGPLAQDTSVRGLMDALALFARGAAEGGAPVDMLGRPFKALADTLEAAHAGRASPLDWRTLLGGDRPDPRELRRFVLIHPVLDYSALQPGERANRAARDAATALGLTPERGVRVRLTGQVPLSDEEFATLEESAGKSAAVTVLLVIVLLWLALRSPKVIAAILVSLYCGLAVTAALGLAMVGALNLISVAFAVLFVGLGVDFGIQLAVAYRAQRYEHDDLHLALRNAGARVGRPLALAAAATALGFFAFLPTAYRGVAELGLIAGLGMVIALAASITMLPALIAVMKPRGEAEPVGLPLARVDAFLARRARAIVAACAFLALGSLAMVPLLRFDFNPLNLRSARMESVATLLDLAKDPQTAPNTIDVLASDLAAADALAAKLSALPEVAQAMTLSSFVPDDQAQKLATIEDAAMLLGPALAESTAAPPDDRENVRAMIEASRALADFAGAVQNADTAVEARRLAAAVSALAEGPRSARDLAHAALIPGLADLLARLRTALQPSTVTRESLPPEIARDWIAADGRARVEVYPAGDATDNRVLDRFVDAVARVAPEAAGAPVTMKESGRAIVTAFIQAGALALAAIAILLAALLRRTADVVLTLAPLALSGLLTLALCVVLGRPLNYANIIALPLLFGIGVAFNIYFVNAWRAGGRALLASSLARAVIFSALTTASAFGSLWLSSHPGTASMGELLALSLACTLGCALIFLPALLEWRRR